MSTKPNKPELADWLRLLAGSQLQTQAARSVALDASALGAMAVTAAVAAIVIDARGAYDLWTLALLLLGLSFIKAVRTLRLPGAERNGPSIADMRKACDDTNEDERSIEDCLTTSRKISAPTTKSWPGKIRLFDRALTFLVLAILVELVGRVVL
jgi:hypothetical protein